MQSMSNIQDVTYAFMRVVTGYLFLWHGTQKFFNFPKPGPGELNTLMTVGAGIEVIGGALVMLGLFTRPAAFICSGTMAVAYWMFHAPKGNPALPILNHGELAVMFCFVFLYIACHGAGKFSLGRN